MSYAYKIINWILNRFMERHRPQMDPVRLAEEPKKSKIVLAWTGQDKKPDWAGFFKYPFL